MESIPALPARLWEIRPEGVHWDKEETADERNRMGRGQILVAEEEASVMAFRDQQWCSSESVKGRAEPSRSLGGMRWWKLWKKVINTSRAPAIPKQDPPLAPPPPLRRPGLDKPQSLFQGGRKGQGFLGSHAAGCHIVP